MAPRGQTKQQIQKLVKKGRAVGECLGALKKPHDEHGLTKNRKPLKKTVGFASVMAEVIKHEDATRVAK